MGAPPPKKKTGWEGTWVCGALQGGLKLRHLFTEGLEGQGQLFQLRQPQAILPELFLEPDRVSPQSKRVPCVLLQPFQTPSHQL